MINSYPGIPTMRNYRAVYRSETSKEQYMDLLPSPSPLLHSQQQN